MNEIKMKAKKTRNYLKVSDSKTYPLKNEERTKNGWRTMKNDGKPSRIGSRKHLGSVTEAPRLEFSSRKQFFSPKQLKCIAKGMMDIWNSPLSRIYRKKGEKVAAQLAWASWRSNPVSKIFWKAPDSKIWKLLFAPPFDKFTPSFVILRKSYGSFTEAYRTWLSSFFSSFSPILSEICLFRVLEILRKHYGSFKQANRTWFPSFSSSLSPILSEIGLLIVLVIFQKHYESLRSSGNHFPTKRGGSW